MASKELDALIRLARSQGVTVERTNGDHYRWIFPNGERRLTGSTPARHGASFRNMVHDLERAGLLTNRAEIRDARRSGKLPIATGTLREHDIQKLTRLLGDCDTVQLASFIADADQVENGEDIPPPGLGELENPPKSDKSDAGTSRPTPTGSPTRSSRSTKNSPRPRQRAKSGQTSTAVNCPVSACKSRPSAKNLSAHMRRMHPRWRQLERGGEWLSPQAIAKKMSDTTTVRPPSEWTWLGGGSKQPDLRSRTLPRSSAALMTAEEAESLGFTVDRHSYPWIAYRGPRFDPTVLVKVQTPPVT